MSNNNSRKNKRPNVHRQRVTIAERYFATHPGEHAFTRPATPAERRVFDLPPASVVRVVKLPSGFAHAYTPPKDAGRT